MGTIKILPAKFNGQAIRHVHDEATDTGWFSVVDVVQVLAQQADFQAARKYWNQLKRRLEKDGKNYLTDVATAQTLLRQVQAVSSPKAEPIKLWLAKVGYARMQEMSGPALSLDRARQTWQQHGRSDRWIQQRWMGQETRNKLIDCWREHNLQEGAEFAILTNIIHHEWSGVSVKDHKNRKGLSNLAAAQRYSTGWASGRPGSMSTAGRRAGPCRAQ